MLLLSKPNGFVDIGDARMSDQRHTRLSLPAHRLEAGHDACFAACGGAIGPVRPIMQAFAPRSDLTPRDELGIHTGKLGDYVLVYAKPVRCTFGVDFV